MAVTPTNPHAEIAERTVASATTSVSTNEITKTFTQRKQNAALLASQYTTTKRIGEYVSVALFVMFISLSFYNIIQILHLNNVWILFTSWTLSMILADLFSGLVHWGADSWGNIDTPLVGTFIRSFREHHVDPYRMTCHDIIETNGDNCLLTLVPLFLLSRANISAEIQTDLFIVNFLVGLCVWVSLTNQIHKWAHMRKPPAFIGMLQDWRIILSRKDHQVHHHTPFDRYYCITTGWLNPLLASIGFWKRMENSITAITGTQPRKDDAYWTVQLGTSNEKEE